MQLWQPDVTANEFLANLGAVGCHFHSQMCMVASCRQLKTSL
jgi:hypothetical protein